MWTFRIQVMKRSRLQVALYLGFLALSAAAWAQSPLGHYVTVERRSGKANAIVVIEEADGQLRGRVVSLINPDIPDPLCHRCTGDRRDQPVVGMQVLWGMKRTGDGWGKGHVLDPKNGRIYRCRMWMEENGNLRVRGYRGRFYRTKTWYKLDPDWKQ
jgi:uncharacterized protein (DUF2147 family)